MLNLEQIQNYFSPQIRENPAHKKYIVKEYIQLMILNFLATSKFVRKITFIGGTNLRLVKGIDRFQKIWISIVRIFLLKILQKCRKWF
jgi:hypothetical protein